MPYLPTSQAFLEQSALLLEAYPDTRITTKYSFPTERPAQQLKRKKSQAKKEAKGNANSTEPGSEPTAPVASLVLKTYHPSTGICLKYQTNKLQEVGRLMTGLGKLAGGADVASLGLSGPGNAGDVEMGDAEDTAGAVAQGAAATPAAGGKTAGKGKKKGGKGKR
ncbi:hypothetical protein N7478_004847 [Penicillium angulare]|uniref:uncharacterized protein n=1 Tax=Penicillium angulare TaxID=116970 RepID=UPI002541B51C|nr:uncharacterized protein N7478_004847 [Penicillium angulare]KAJ5279475.1 hypothetical protein N7478_004847 [Penicillium angulare]